MIKSEIIKLLKPSNLEKLIPGLSPCFNLVKVFKKEKMKLGNNKLGGKPHLAKNTNWPKINDREATFVCQINLETLDVGKLELDSKLLGLKLPKTGLLSFFVHSLFTTQTDYNDEFDYDKPNCTLGYWSMLNKMVELFPLPLEHNGFELPSNIIPDISTGILFNKFLKEKDYEISKICKTYTHIYPDGRKIVGVKQYPDTLYPLFTQWFQTEWLQKKLCQIHYQKN